MVQVKSIINLDSQQKHETDIATNYNFKTNVCPLNKE